ncbi:DUF6252 family protein [Desulfosarcina sp.]|nr:DUF6252 family protein [Desulfosarcina sp.]
MNKFRLVFLLGILLTLTIISCTKDDKRVDPPVVAPPVGDQIFTALVNGNEWNASDMLCIMSTKGITTLRGIEVNGPTITININDTIENSYILNLLSPNQASVETNALIYSTAKNLGTGGQVDFDMINKQDSVISGTFAFAGYNSTSGEYVEVTNGEFKDIRYVIEEPSITDNSLRANIDGILFIADTVSGLATNDTIHIIGNSIPDTASVQFKVPINISAGVYQLTLNGAYRAFYIRNDSILQSFNGTLTIESHQDIHQTIQGKYEFSALVPGTTSSAELTNGSFQLFYDKGIKKK